MVDYTEIAPADERVTLHRFDLCAIWLEIEVPNS